MRAISRAAGPGERRLVAELIEFAQHATVGQLETAVRGLRTIGCGGEGDGIGVGRVPVAFLEADSRWRVAAQLDRAPGVLVQSGVEAIASAEGIGHPDALVRMAEIVLAALTDSRTRPRGQERAGAGSGRDPPGRRGRARPTPRRHRTPRRRRAGLRGRPAFS